MDSLYEESARCIMKKIIVMILAFAMLSACASMTSCGKSSGDAPNGMKLISSDVVSYSLYVPNSWQADVAAGATTAYYSSTDTSSVSVMVFTLNDVSMSAKDWWNSYRADYEEVYKDFEVISEEETVLDGVAAMKFVFTGALTHTENDGSGAEKDEFKFMQVAAIKSKPLSSPEIYVFTYTSSPAQYDSHLTDVENMLAYFKFK